MCTSRRPGLRMASSIWSLRFVMPMRRMLLRGRTPSILLRSWLTTESFTPVESLLEPLFLQSASISSIMMMWSSESSPLSFYSASASLKSSRTFFSLPPTNLSKISGPDMTLGSFVLRQSAIFLAISVFPVPGGPYSNMPLK